jgi:hypothetical protein
MYIQKYKWIQIRWVENTGPYRKLLPLLEEKWGEDCLIITLDDDTEYHPQLIENYVKDYNEHKVSIAYRGFTLDLASEMNYNNRIHPTLEKCISNFSTGKGGVVYNPTLFRDKTIFNKSGYMLAATNDDIWFNFVRMKSDIPLVIKNKPYMITDNTSTEYALFSNFNNSANTSMMKDVWDFLDKLCEV